MCFWYHTFVSSCFWGNYIVTRVQSLGEEDPLEKEWQPTPVSLPGKSHGQRSLAGYSAQDHKELDTTEQLSNNSIICWRSGARWEERGLFGNTEQELHSVPPVYMPGVSLFPWTHLQHRNFTVTCYCSWTWTRTWFCFHLLSLWTVNTKWDLIHIRTRSLTRWLESQY